MQCTLMVLCCGMTQTGDHFWAYVCIASSNAKAFKDARERGTLVLEDYGTVLEWGLGEAPDANTMQRMERDFGMNHHLEEEMLRKAASA